MTPGNSNSRKGLGSSFQVVLKEQIVSNSCITHFNIHNPRYFHRELGNPWCLQMLSTFFQEHLGASKSQVGKNGQKTQTRKFSLPSGSFFFLKYFISTHYPFLLMDGNVCLVNEKPEINVQNSCFESGPAGSYGCYRYKVGRGMLELSEDLGVVSLWIKAFIHLKVS